MQLSIFNSLLPQVFNGAQPDSNHRPISLRDFFEISKAFGRFSFFEPTNKPPCTTSSHPLFCWWAQMDSNHRRFGLRDFSNLKTVRKVYTFKPRNKKLLVGSNGLEPSTSRLSGVCSNQLSYEPIFWWR